MIKIGIVGGTGYTGVELLRLLAQHPHAELAVITSRKEAGTRVADLFPSLRGHIDFAFAETGGASLAKCDVITASSACGCCASSRSSSTPVYPVPPTIPILIITGPHSKGTIAVARRRHSCPQRRQSRPGGGFRRFP